MRPMEIVGVINLVLRTVKFSIDLLKTDRKLSRDMKNGLEELKNELVYLKIGLEKEGWESYDKLRLMELIYNIEDFAQSLWIPGASGGPVLSAIGMDPRERYVEDITSFRKQIEDLVAAQQKKSAESKPEQGGGCSSDPASSSTAAGGYTPVESLVGITEPKQVILELLEKPASSEQAGGQDAKKPPKVISIVGCPGVGKTALARAVYDHYITTAASDEFECVAWVEAAGCNDETALLGKILQKVQADLSSRASLTALLAKIVQKVQANLASRSSLTALPGKILQKVPATLPSRASLTALLGKILQKVADLASSASHTLVPLEGDGNTASPDLRRILADKRYLVFIDDIQQAKVLNDTIYEHFPKNAESGMIIVTTSIHQVANVCSPGSYVYTMKCLGSTESENLLCRQAFNKTREGVGSAMLLGAESIITKCGGLPLALISVAEHLSINATKVDRYYCNKVMIKKLRSHLEGSNTKEEFMKLGRALGQCYDSLPDYDHKNCMLSLSIFPRGHAIKMKSLVRRLIAEGLVAGGGRECLDNGRECLDDGRECLDELVNRCIVEPVQISSRSNDVKSCRVNVGIMLEFIILKSRSTNFVTLIREKEVVHNSGGRIRRLSVQSKTTKDKFQEVAQKNSICETIRSLTFVIPSEGKRDLSEIKRCKFLRLLDLEGYKKLDVEFFKDICDLVYLKYLSLRRTNVEKIPREIRKLCCLQTLDIRETTEMRLPIEVINLPELVSLFGQFVLPDMYEDTKIFLKGKSKLHTIAEFVVDQWNGSEHIIFEGKDLKKVKVRFRDTNNEKFFLSLRNCFSSLESLSMQSDQLSPDIMASLDASVQHSVISRMKLSGQLRSLPTNDTLKRIANLSKLQLSCRGFTSVELSRLQYIPCLEYLKLQADHSWDGIFSVHKDGFESLRLLCFKTPKLPRLKFETGSMQSLTSLHLLCEDISEMQVAEEISESIKHITSLNEVVLHCEASREVVDAWKVAAKSNPSRPRVSNALRDE